MRPMAGFAFLLSFSISAPSVTHLSAFLQSSNVSLTLAHASPLYLRHPLFLLTNRHSPAHLTLFSSHFSKFSAPIVHAVSHSLSVDRAIFANAASRAVTLTSAEIASTEVGSRHVARAPTDFRECKFHALSAVHGETEDTIGGAVFADGIDVTFKSCTFSGNAAVSGGSCNLVRGHFSFELCNFTNNRATFEAGVISIESAVLDLSESNFVQNEAELYVGVLKSTNSTINGEALIFHGNRAVFHSAVIDEDGSKAEFTASQFSANRVDNEEGGITHNLKASRVRLVGCVFETIARENGAKRQPIRSDVDSQVVIRQSCFDTNEQTLREAIEGEYSNNIGTVFTDKCQCSRVVVPQAYDIVEKSIKLDDALLTRQFLVSAIGLVLATLIVVILLVFEIPVLKLKWFARA